MMTVVLDMRVARFATRRTGIFLHRGWEGHPMSKPSEGIGLPYVLSNFEVVRYQFWSPVVPVGYLTMHLAEIDGLELVINEEYAKRVDDLQALARKLKNDTGNPFFRVLQILGHLRR